MGRQKVDYTLEYEITCQNLACPSGDMVNGRYQAWWDDVGHPEGKRTTEARTIVELDLADEIMQHLDICEGPMQVTELSRKKNGEH